MRLSSISASAPATVNHDPPVPGFATEQFAMVVPSCVIDPTGTLPLVPATSATSVIGTAVPGTTWKGQRSGR